MKNTITVLFLSTLSSVGFASTFNCVSPNMDPIQVSVNGGKVELSDKTSKMATSRDFNCEPHGKSGLLFVGGSGANSWGFRLPTEITSVPQSINIEFVFDDDSDGMDCTYDTLKCNLIEL